AGKGDRQRGKPRLDQGSVTTLAKEASHGSFYRRTPHLPDPVLASAVRPSRRTPLQHGPQRGTRPTSTLRRAGPLARLPLHPTPHPLGLPLPSPLHRRLLPRHRPADCRLLDGTRPAALFAQDRSLLQVTGTPARGAAGTADPGPRPATAPAGPQPLALAGPPRQDR